MLIRFFKSGLPSRYLALLMMALVLRMPALLQTAPKPSTGYIPFYISNLFPFSLSFPLQWIVSLILILFTAFLVNYLSVRYGFTEKNSTLAAFFFILGSGVFPVLRPLNIYVIVTFLTALFFVLTYKIREAESEIRAAFDAGLGLGVLVLFYPEALLLVIFIWLALISYRVNQWRAYIVSLIGTATPFALMFAGFFLFGTTKGLLPAVYTKLIPIFSLIHFPSLLNLITGGILGAMVILSLIQVIGVLRTMNIDLMQHTMTTLWGLLMIFLILTLLEAPVESAVLICVPASLVLAVNYDTMKNLKWANVFLMVFLLLILVNNYFSLFYAS
ncbi:MAG: hypothetical protein IH595_02760 [Bacteroidales bacterium]|nr:hypothetical protein [Bacteroidales bacterium]